MQAMVLYEGEKVEIIDKWTTEWHADVSVDAEGKATYTSKEWVVSTSNDVVGAWKPDVMSQDKYYSVDQYMGIEERNAWPYRIFFIDKYKWNYFRTREDAVAVRDLKVFVLDNWEYLSKYGESEFKRPIASRYVELRHRCEKITYQNNDWKKCVWLQWL